MFLKYRDAIVVELPSGLIAGLREGANSLKRTADVIVLAMASAISFIGWKFYFDQNLVLAYNDSMSHLDIARRVVDGLNPGIAQIGSVWLPLPHLLSLPFVWSDFLWHSGLAGTLISCLAFIGTAYFLYRLVLLLTRDTISGILASLVYILNPNIIYLQATPMTESLLLFFFVISTYYLLLWQKKDSYKYLALAGFYTLAATLTRYDGWMLLAQMLIVVAIISYRFGKWKKVEGNLFLFGTIAVYGILLWFLWNLLIFQDPLYFLNGPFSAKAQQLVFEAEGRLPTKHDLLYSSYIYILAVLRNNGALLSLLGGVGLIGFLFRKKLSSETLVISLLLSPLIFNIAALFTGNSIINLLELPPYTLFNVRYGIMMLPFVAVMVAYLARRQRLIQLLFLIVLLLQTASIYRNDDVITVKDGISGASAQGMTETGRWLGENAKSGLILIAASSQDSLIFQSGLPMTRFIYEGDGEYWKESLADPTSHASYIAMHHGDLIYREIFDKSSFLLNYKKIYDGEFTDIFEYSPDAEIPLTAKDLP
ncbi:MAG: glycosyltransferase family 39 protein [Patescibacteria group bacterium]